VNYPPIDAIIQIEDQRDGLITALERELHQRIRVIEGSIHPTSFTVVDPMDLAASRAEAIQNALLDHIDARIAVEREIDTLYRRAMVQYCPPVEHSEPDITPFVWRKPE